MRHRHLAVVLLLAACVPADRALAPRPTAAARSARPDETPSVGQTRLALERAADGLLYTSESDHPFTYVRRAAPPSTAHDVATGDPDLHAFRVAFGIPDHVPVQTIPLDEFLARHIERIDPADPVAAALVPRYVHLRETLRERLRDVRVHRVGTIAIDCWAVGFDATGHLVGLHTVAIET